MKRTIAIVGTGWVGTSIAVSVLQQGVADELLLHDARRNVAEGEALDLSHGAPFVPHASVRVAEAAEIRSADVVVIAAGRGGHPGESRLDLLRDNRSLVARLGEQLVGFPGIVVVVTNPVDVLTRVVTDASRLSPVRVLSTGTMLDTARLRQMVGERLRVDPRSVHAAVIGEHGDSEVVVWSAATIGGVPIRRWPGWTPADEQTIGERVRRAAYEIIQRKGATNHAIGLVTADLLRCVLRDERRVLTVARIQQGACGLHDVALSLPAVVGADGADLVLEPEMTADERQALERSAALLRARYDER
jgi:L-lactate dehydrogenase